VVRTAGDRSTHAPARASMRERATDRARPSHRTIVVVRTTCVGYTYYTSKTSIYHVGSTA